MVNVIWGVSMIEGALRSFALHLNTLRSYVTVPYRSIDQIADVV